MSADGWGRATRDQERAYTVVLLPTGKSVHTASPSDFKRVVVRARNDFEARTASEVIALLKGRRRYVAEVAIAGTTPDAVTAATVRAREAADEVPAIWRSPNNARASAPTWPKPLGVE